MKIQQELVKAYPDMPVLDANKTYGWNDYAYASHDQVDYLYKAMMEIKSMHDSHFMTKKNKELMRERKQLQEELKLSKSQGPYGQGAEEMEQMRNQLDASQRAHKITTQRITEIESQYQGLLDQEKTKGKQAGHKLARIEADKERLSQQLNQMLQNYRELEANHNELMNTQGANTEDQERLLLLQEQIAQLQQVNSELENGNTAMREDLQQMQLQLQGSKVESGGDDQFERDENQGSLEVAELQAPPKEKRFLLSELKQIKDQCYQKLLMFKART